MTVRGGKATAFCVQISKEQRQMFLEALKPYAELGKFGFGLKEDAQEEVNIMILMLEALPKDEQEHPGMIHCLYF